MSESARTAAALAAALPRLVALGSRRLVVKLGGSAMEEPAALTATLQDIALLALFGQRIVVVHGGGKAIDRALETAGIVPVKIRGRRVTDHATLTVVVRVLSEKVNAALVRQLSHLGARAAGWHSGLRGKLLTSPDGDLGRVGEVTDVAVDRLEEMLKRNVLPVVPSLALDCAGAWLNVNADDAAAAVAVAWQADALVFLTDTPGLLRDVADPNSRFDRLTRADIDRHVADGTIAGGMVPKTQGCASALEQGVGRVLILDGRVHHALLMETLDGRVEGTEISQ